MNELLAELERILTTLEQQGVTANQVIGAWRKAAENAGTLQSKPRKAVA